MMINYYSKQSGVVID